jgi:hypothetical protein
MKRVKADRGFDMRVGAALWVTMILVIGPLVLLIITFGWGFLVVMVVVITFLTLVYCTGWLGRRIFGLEP